MKLYGHPASTCTRKVLTTLAEKGAEAEFVLVDLMTGAQKSADHLARQPFGVVPAIDDDGFALYESRAIIRYLDETLPGKKLSPADAKGRAVMEQWISVEYSYFTPAAMKIISECLFKKMQGLEPDMAVVEGAKKNLARYVDVLGKRLASSTYLAGEEFTLADIGYLPYIEYLFASGHGDVIDANPAVASWWRRCAERPSWMKATGKGAKA
jgi:glutathione S-transferase